MSITEIVGGLVLNLPVYVLVGRLFWRSFGEAWESIVALVPIAWFSEELEDVILDAEDEETSHVLKVIGFLIVTAAVLLIEYSLYVQVIKG